MNSFAKAHHDLLEQITRDDIRELNERTGVQILMLEGGASFKLDLWGDGGRLGRLPVPGNRRYYPHIAAAEVAWQFMGTKDPSFILQHAPKLWSKFIEDGELKTAYGHRWRAHFGRDQIALAVQELRRNPTNRQLYISAWDPAADGLGGPQPKNIPCPVGFSVSLSNQRLHASVFIRSSDVFVGLPYDVMGYALTLDAIAASVGVKTGTLHVTMAHPHVYEPHWEHMGQVFQEADEPVLPGWTISMILANPHGYVATVKKLAAIRKRPDWDPKPVVIE